MIHIFWPTIRPNMAAERARRWIERSRCGYESKTYQFVFCAEPDADINPLLELPYPHMIVMRVKSPYPGVCHSATTMTHGIEVKNSDVVILASDDFEPTPSSGPSDASWDEAIVQFSQAPERGCLLDDGYAIGTGIVPMPIVTGALLRRLNGILYNPAYHHFFSDQELYDILVEMGEIRNSRGGRRHLFVHHHHTFGKRTSDCHDKNNHLNWGRDMATYDARKKTPLTEKLKLPEGWK